MCWSSHRDIRDSWVVERQPRADERVSDADRQATIDQLSRHTGDGRLTLEDFEARVDEAWQAKTHGDLQHVLRELPVERVPLHRRHPDAQLRRAAALVLIIVGAAFLMGPWSLWWLIPLAWFKLGAFGRHSSRGYHEPRELPPRRDELTLV
jgi:uncharacterized protein DUF1707